MARTYTVEANGRMSLKPLPAPPKRAEKEQRLRGVVRASVYDGQRLQKAFAPA